MKLQTKPDPFWFTVILIKTSFRETYSSFLKVSLKSALEWISTSKLWMMKYLKKKIKNFKKILWVSSKIIRFTPLIFKRIPTFRNNYFKCSTNIQIIRTKYLTQLVLSNFTALNLWKWALLKFGVPSSIFICLEASSVIFSS
jgi:hypothetical protein